MSSNFGQAHLEKLAQTAAVAPAVNQLEVHPWLQRRDLVAYCAAHGIVVEARAGAIGGAPRVRAFFQQHADAR